MFERVIAQTIQKITAETLQERSLIPLADILQDSRIPARIKPFFETEVHWWLYNDHLARAANKRFDYEHPELASLLNYLEQVQFRHARFEREEFVSVLDSAVKLIYNYLCRPQTTLKWYIFRGQPVKPLNEVMLRFSAFIDYDYFRTVFIEWVERKRAERPTFDAISATEFERVIRRTDDQILLHCTVEDLLDMMGPLFEFIGEGPEQKLPVDALIIFFDDKNIKKLVDQLEAYRDRGGADVGRDDFVALLDELLSTAEEGPEADFSNVYQNDELDDVVRQHLQGGYRESAAADQEDLSDDLLWEEPVAEAPTPIPAGEPAAPVAGASPRDLPQPPAPPVEPPAAGEDFIDDDEEWPIDEDAAGDQEPALAEAGGERLHGSIRSEALYAPGGERLYGVEGMEEDDDDLDFDDEDDELAAGGGMHVPDPDAGSSRFGDPAVRFAPFSPDAGSDAVPPQETPAEDIATASATENGVAQEHAGASNGVHHAPESAPGVPGYPLVAHPEGEPVKTDPTQTMPTIEPSVASEVPAPQPQPVIPRVAPAMADVRRFIDPGLERKVIKKIFAKNRADYEVALDRLNAAQNWKTASQVLDELFLKYNVDPYSRTAIRFTDSVYGRYLP